MERTELSPKLTGQQHLREEPKTNTYVVTSRPSATQDASPRDSRGIHTYAST
jgi:hypothetical protein